LVSLGLAFIELYTEIDRGYTVRYQQHLRVLCCIVYAQERIRY